LIEKRLPEGWKWEKIKDFSKRIDLIDPTKSPEEQFYYIDIDSIDNSSQRIRNPKLITGKTAPSRARQIIKKGDILFSTVRPYLKNIAIVNETNDAQIASTGFSVIRVNEEVSNKYLFYFLKSEAHLNELKKYYRGANYPAISESDLLRQQFPLTPLATQHKIVDILEKAEATQRLRAEADELMQDLLQNVFLEMFGDPSIKSTNWLFERLGNVIDVTSGHGFKLEEYSDDGIRLLRINNVSFGDIIWEQIAYLPFEYVSKFPHLVLKKDDILIALNRPILGGRLKVGMMDEEDAPAILYQRVGRIDILDEERVNRQYLFHLLRTRYFLSELSVRLSGSDQPYINPTAMVKIKIPLPPIAIQERFAQIATNIQLTYDTGQSSRNQLQNLFQAIIDRAFTGDLTA
jgi:type I restriction enzyme S subunit